MSWNAALIGVAASGCLVLVGPCFWVWYRASRGASVEQLLPGSSKDRGAELISSHRCWARLLFCSSDELAFVLDAVVEQCEDATVPLGMPFSLRVASPPDTRSWVAFQLEPWAEQEQLVLVELQDSPAGPKARFLAGDLALVLPLEEASGWPTFDPPTPSAYDRS
jgi:hypothetical protein